MAHPPPLKYDRNTTTAIAYGDWLLNVARVPPDWREHAASVFEALLFAIIGFAGGLSLASLPSNREKVNLARKTEQHPGVENAPMNRG